MTMKMKKRKNIQRLKKTEEQEITKKEFKNAVKKMKLGKAAGHNQSTPEMIKYMGKTAEELLLRIFQKACNEKKIVKYWEVAIIISIFKKGNNRECKNHRGISLLSVPGMIYSRILETRSRQEM
jgi:hypothetical protein